MGKPHTVWLFTNRLMIVFDANGQQLPEEQGAVSCYHIDREHAARIIEQAEFFELAKWRGWSHSITRKEIQYLLGLRTREMDLAQEDDV